MLLADSFDTFYDRISLGVKPTQKIETATGGLARYLEQAYSLPAGAVFLQGSYPNGTAVEPGSPDGEYDADLVAICASSGATCNQALDELEAVLANHGTYAELIKKEGARKKPCVRLRYADDDVGGFHVDVVPARRCISSPLEVPRRGEPWHDSAPREYTDWCRQRGERFARTVKMLKRWREVNQPAQQSIKSIVLQVLACNNLGSQRSDTEALVSTFVGMQSVLTASPNTAPRVQNPVLPSEDLAGRWNDTAYRNFGKALDEAVALSQKALASASEQESHDLWRELLGDDFPPAPTRIRTAPATPPPGFHTTPQVPPRRERYGS
jgi:Second Messenger Oligonucleotide or Dinucleotide Synthetase domain